MYWLSFIEGVLKKCLLIGIGKGNTGLWCRDRFQSPCQALLPNVPWTLSPSTQNSKSGEVFVPERYYLVERSFTGSRERYFGAGWHPIRRRNVTITLQGNQRY